MDRWLRATVNSRNGLLAAIRSEAAFRQALDRHRPRMVALCEDNFNFLTKMCLTRNRELAFAMCQAAKEAGLPVVVNSSDATDHVAEYIGGGAEKMDLIGPWSFGSNSAIQEAP